MVNLPCGLHIQNYIKWIYGYIHILIRKKKRKENIHKILVYILTGWITKIHFLVYLKDKLYIFCLNKATVLYSFKFCGSEFQSLILEYWKVRWPKLVCILSNDGIM